MRYIAVLFVLVLAGCAVTYSPPTLKQVNFSEPLKQPRAETFAAAKRALVLDGYQIASSDEAAGVISTAPRQMRLTANDADCGTTAGLPYIKDERTITSVSVGLVLSDSDITVRSTIEGEYLKGHVVQSIDLVCVSKGTIERRILASIR